MGKAEKQEGNEGPRTRAQEGNEGPRTRAQEGDEGAKGARAELQN